MIDPKILQDPYEAWRLLTQALRAGKEFSTFSIRNQEGGRRFKATWDGKYILIEPSDSGNSVRLNTPRKITIQDLECVLKYYSNYIQEIPGTRKKMGECSQNTSYVITLIRHILDK